MSRPTLLRPSPAPPHHSPIEAALELLPLSDIAPDIFTNARPLWHPPGARGIFGGAAIAQCLSAAQQTIPASEYTVHSMHCYFVLAGNSSVPVLYHVERVRDGRSFITRTVQARQRGKCIFTTTISFMREGSGGKRCVEHALQMPEGLEVPPDGDILGEADDTPFESVNLGAGGEGAGRPETTKLRQWIRARGRISDSEPSSAATSSSISVDGTDTDKGPISNHNHQAHLSAMAYMSDSYFIGTVARVHNLQRFSNRRNIDRILSSFKGSPNDRDAMRRYLERMAKQEAHENESQSKNPAAAAAAAATPDDRRIGMMVSLDHSIFFHNPRAFRADDWMLTEMDTPWAGDGRGLVTQRLWTRDGKLIATCIQEGCIRLQQEKEIKL